MTRVLLVESGSRALGEQAIERIRSVFGAELPVDALICRSEAPASASRCWSVLGLHTARLRWALLRELRAQRHPVVAVLSSGDPTMAPWKWATAAMLPAKFLIVNENADFFWLDRGHWSNLVALGKQRSGLGGESAVRTLFRFVAYPFAFVYLLAYAAWVHTVRALRLLLGLKHRARSA